MRELERLTLARGTPRVIVSDNELSKKAMARDEHTSAVARRASNAGYDCAIVEKAMHRPGSLRVGAPSRVRSHSSPADAALDQRRVIVQCCGSGGHESGGFPRLIVSGPSNMLHRIDLNSLGELYPGTNQRQ